MNSSNTLKRPRSPSNNAHGVATPEEAVSHDDRRQALLRDLDARSERLIARLYSPKRYAHHQARVPVVATRECPEEDAVVAAAPETFKTRKAIDEDDYGDDEDDEDGQDAAVAPAAVSPNVVGAQSRTPSRRGQDSTELLGARSTANIAQSDMISASIHRNDHIAGVEAHPRPGGTDDTNKKAETAEDVRKRLEQEKKDAEDAVKENFQAMFYTLENDRDAMIEQQKLDELERQVENEVSDANANQPSQEAQGTLSTTNLGASSLTLKHLFARIDANRSKVGATDAQLRTLVSEVRKNRSKWASEDRIGQEELYEAAERVLMELKSMTEYAAPFLTKVKRVDAPDYHRIIKDPMDLGTMTKKLQKAQYDSKEDFCNDLNLIWANCLIYNTAPDHPFRKKAQHMQKESGRLIPLIPEVIIRDRKDVEREDQQQAEGSAGSESDDDNKPIAASRGRKAPAKSSKGTAGQSRKAQKGEAQSVETEARPQSLPAFRSDLLKKDTDSADGSQLDTATPPRLSTPAAQTAQVNGSADDQLEVEGSAVGQGIAVEEPDEEDEAYRLWKRVTKKDRARIAADRHRLFRGDKLNVDEPALLRTKRAMRRWVKQQATRDHAEDPSDVLGAGQTTSEQDASSGMLADDMSREDENTLPDYYDPLSAIPHIPKALEWVTDADGQAVDQREDCLRLLPQSYFKAPTSTLTTKLDRNLRQIQETRKVAAKILIVNQMQTQTQTYQNQFQKYAPEPFIEADTNPVVTSDDGPYMCSTIARAALQRSIGKILYAAGFEDFQPSALEAATDIASDYFLKLVRTIKLFTELPKVRAPAAESNGYLHKFSPEAVVLHTLYQNGLDLNEMDAYVTEATTQLPTKLETHHARMRDYYAELLRPALDPAAVGTDGAGAFNDGNESQFVAGDFAEDIDEDFFGFKELGLDREFGLASLSVPLHLLQSRMSSIYQPTDPSAAIGNGSIMETPPSYESVTAASLEDEISLVHDYFTSRLEKTEEGQGPLIEDEELPAKQRFPKPRLPPNGKISSPRKRPLREQQMLARKRKRAEIEAERARERELEGAANATSGTNGIPTLSSDPLSSLPDPDSEPLAKMPRLSNGITNGTSKVGDSSIAANDETEPLINGPSLAPGKAAMLDGKSGDPTKKKTQTGGEEKAKKKKSSAKGAKQDEVNDDGDAEGEKDEPNGVLSPSLPIAAH